MQRAWLPLALILAVCVGVLLWPMSNSVADNSDPSAAVSERGGERGLAEVGSLPELGQFSVNPLELVPGDREVKSVREGGGVLSTEVGSDVDFATVRVRVINENGSPLEGVSVGVIGIVSVDTEGDLRSLKPIFFAVQGAPVEVEGVQVNEVMSDGEGVVELSAPEGVQIVVYARLARHLISFKLSGDLVAGETRDLGDLRLAPGGHLEVRVLDEYGVAIEDAAVFMALTDGGDFEEEVSLHFLETDKDGSVIFQHLSFNDYKLDVAKHGFQHYHQNPVSITQRGDGLVEVMLPRGDAMAGTVVDSFGAPVEGVTVTARARERKHRLEGMAEGLLGPVPPVITGAEGSFRMEGMFEDAEYTLVADPERGLSARSREKPSEQLRIVLPETAFVIGRVISSEGEPVPEGRVGFRPESGRWPRPTWKRTGADGRFEVELSPGRYSYSISHALGERYSLDPQEFRGEIDLGDLQLEPGGRIEFSFLSPRGEAADAVRFRSLNRVDGAAESEPRTTQWLRRPINGDETAPMIFEGLTSGAYALRIDSSQWLAPITTFEVRAGRTDKIDVELGFGAILILNLQGEDGGVIDGRFRLERDGSLPPQWGHLDATHRFRMRSGREIRVEAIVPGNYTLREDRRGSEPFAELNLGPGESAHTITVPKRSN